MVYLIEGSANLISLLGLGLFLSSAVLVLEKNIVINPKHPALSQIKVVNVFDLIYYVRMLKWRMK
ncbi:hypothetical protein AB3464_01545 [Pseudomonas asplenii]|uniref:hypothetical protein n=1 Tax=Pseudomonas asplenii TaxID=53407 RepID=UPI0037C865CF